MSQVSSAARKQELVSKLEQSRQNITHHKARLRQSLDVKTRVTRSVAKNPVPWAVGSGLLGLLGSRAFFKSRKKKKQAPEPQVKPQTIKRMIVAALIATFRPAFKEIVVDRLKDILLSRAVRS